MDQRGRGIAAAKLTATELGSVGDAGALAHYADPAYYDFAYRARRHDVSYYVGLARKLGGPVLEYGVGSGRIALELARAGIDVVGVDLSAPMLGALKEALSREPREVRARVRSVRGDMRRVRLRRRFPLVIAPFNVVLHLYTRSDVEAFLARVSAHLAPRGRFVFDFSVPQPGDLDRDPSRWHGAPRFRHPKTGELLRYAERFDYDPLRQLLVVWMRFSPVAGGREWTLPLTHRQFFPQEMEALLHYGGFVSSFTEAFSGKPAGDDVDALLVTSLARRSVGR